MTKRFFVALTGQDDNIGDVVLRRRLLREPLMIGECHIWVGSVSRSFLEALAIPDEHFVYTDWRKWMFSLLRSAIRTDADLIHNPGQIDTTVRDLVFQALLVPASLIIRAKGNRVLRIGQGLKQERKLSRLLRLFSLLDSATIWRDPESQRIMHSGEVGPDWAFDEPFVAKADNISPTRPYMTITMRFDRPLPHDAWFAAVESVAKQLNLTVTVTAQVIRDNLSGQILSDRLGVDFIPWSDGTDHATQEHLVRDLYRRSAIVVSDRLHALVMGLTEGAIPVAPLTEVDVKIGRHFRAANLPAISLDSRGKDQAELASLIEAIWHQRDSFIRALPDTQERIRSYDRLIGGG